MSSDLRFSVVLDGTVNPGSDPAAAQQHLAKLFKVPTDKAAALLSGQPRTIKKGLDQAKAEQFQRAIQAGGASCHLEPEDAGGFDPGATMIMTGAAEAAVPTADETVVSPAPSPAASTPASASIQSSDQPSGKHSLEQFVEKTRQRDRGQGRFELESRHMLEVNLDGEVMIKHGAMVAYRGEMVFEREGMLDKGFKKLLKKSVTGEGVQLTRVGGMGQLYLADLGKQVTILELDGEAIYVNGNDILALETDIDWDIKMMKKITAMMAGGLFNARLEGHGLIAITTHHSPMTLEVTPDNPVVTDPNATIAWSASLEPEIIVQASLKTFLGR
ncbi:MAG: AIM24 family protein, partial [Gammaproteobacteria bacterium]